MYQRPQSTAWISKCQHPRLLDRIYANRCDVANSTDQTITGSFRHEQNRRILLRLWQPNGLSRLDATSHHLQQARRHVELKPILLGGVFKGTDNQSPVVIKPKGKWLLDDVARYAKHYGIDYAMNPHFIVNTMPAMRGAIWAQTSGHIEAYNTAIYTAMWADQKDIAQLDVIEEVLTTARLDAAAMGDAIQQTDVTQSLIDATTAAVEAGSLVHRQ